MERAVNFAKSGIKNPKILDEIPDGANVILFSQDNPELNQRNEDLANALAKREEVIRAQDDGLVLGRVNNQNN